MRPLSAWQRWLLQLVRVSGEDTLPQHVAFIMDGNRRYAKKLQHPTLAGHKEGARTLCRLCEACVLLGIKYVTVYGFALGNFHRPPEEVNGLLELAEETFANREWIKFFVRNRICLRLLGDLSYLPVSLRETLRNAAAETAAACQPAAPASDLGMPDRNAQTPANAAAETMPDKPPAPVDTTGSPVAGRSALNASADGATASSICPGDEDNRSLLLTICVAYGSRNEMARSLAPPSPTLSRRSATAFNTTIGGRPAHVEAATTVSTSSGADSADFVSASSVELATANAVTPVSTASRICPAAELADSPTVAVTSSISSASINTSSCAADACTAGTPKTAPAAAATSSVASSSDTFVESQVRAGSVLQTVVGLPPTAAFIGDPACIGAGAAIRAAAVPEASSAVALGDTSSSSLSDVASTPYSHIVSESYAISDTCHKFALARKSSPTYKLRHVNGAGSAVASPSDAAIAAGAGSFTLATANHAASSATLTLKSRAAELVASQGSVTRHECCSSSRSKNTVAHSPADAYVKRDDKSPCMDRETHSRGEDGRNEQPATLHDQAGLQMEQQTKKTPCRCNRYYRSNCCACSDASRRRCDSVCGCDGFYCCCCRCYLDACGDEAIFPYAVESCCLQTAAASPSRALSRAPYFCEELLHRLLQGKGLDAPNCGQELQQ